MGSQDQCAHDNTLPDYGWARVEKGKRCPTCDGDSEVGTLLSSDALKLAPIRGLGSGQHQAMMGPLILQHNEVTLLHLLPVLVPAHRGVLSVHLTGQHDALGGYGMYEHMLLGVHDMHWGIWGGGKRWFTQTLHTRETGVQTGPMAGRYCLCMQGH